MRSLDGIHWKNEEGLPYDVSTTYYTDGTKNEWYKFERPKVLQDDIGRVTHLALAVMDVSKGADKGNDNHSSKNMVMPLVVEKLVSIVGEKPIDRSTKRINVLIEAEDGFDPVEGSGCRVPALRLGFGGEPWRRLQGGPKPSRRARSCWWPSRGTTGSATTDYDFKLIGETKGGELIVGYALLPERSAVGRRAHHAAGARWREGWQAGAGKRAGELGPGGVRAGRGHGLSTHPGGREGREDGPTAAGGILREREDLGRRWDRRPREPWNTNSWFPKRAAGCRGGSRWTIPTRPSPMRAHGNCGSPPRRASWTPSMRAPRWAPR